MVWHCQQLEEAEKLAKVYCTLFVINRLSPKFKVSYSDFIAFPSLRLKYWSYSVSSEECSILEHTAMC